MNPQQMGGQTPLAARMALQVAALRFDDLPPAVVDKARTCILDLVGAAIESSSRPWSEQARAMAVPMAAGSPGAATVIASPTASSVGDAAFVNGTMGHGLVREDMHSASISHLGVAIIPALLALTQHQRVSGRDLLAAVVAGYEVGAQVGSAAIDGQLARIRRPTGISGPLGAAAGGARLLGLDATQATHALGLAANFTAGLNEWGHTGGSEMFFHVGFAARSGVNAVLLAEAGAFGSPSALDGPAGLFASLGKREAAAGVRTFDGPPQILSVYHKPVPACNFAQTACQAALALARTGRFDADAIEAIRIRVPRAAATYPGCDTIGPFAHILQAKMSIQYNVAASLLTGRADEGNFELLQDPALHRLLRACRLEIDENMSRAYPAQQGGEVAVLLKGGARESSRLADVVNATPQEVRRRFEDAANPRLGAERTARILRLLDGLEHLSDAAEFTASLAAPTGPNPKQT